MAGAVDLELFSSYELGQVLEQLQAAAAEHHDAPGLTALRAADRAGLLYLGRDPWNDASWVLRHEALRAACVAEHGETITVTLATEVIARILHDKQLVEDAGPF